MGKAIVYLTERVARVQEIEEARDDRAADSSQRVVDAGWQGFVRSHISYIGRRRPADHARQTHLIEVSVPAPSRPFDPLWNARLSAIAQRQHLRLGDAR